MSYVAIIAKFSASTAAILRNLSQAGKSRKQFVAIVVDSLLAVVSLWFAYSLRLGEFFTNFSLAWQYFLIVMGATPVIFAGFGIYKWVIRSSNSKLLVQLLKGVVVTSVTLLISMFLVRTHNDPRSLFVIFSLLLFFSSAGIRLLWQRSVATLIPDSRGEPVAIYGAGRQARELISMLNLSNKGRVVVVIDDNPALDSSTFAGIPVVDPAKDGLRDTLLKYEANRVILASPHLDHARIQRLLRSTSGINMPVQILPSINEVVAGTAAAGQAREVTLADLLGRDEVPPDTELLCASVTGKNVLITGGGGSIGSEICRQTLQLGALNLVVLDHGEENLYKITEEIEQEIQKNTDKLSAVNFVPVLGSIADNKKVEKIINNYNIQTIFHAAAYKHVPIIESAIWEGFRTNVLGTRNVLDAAISLGVERFVLISTDKAVRPTNAMGATKRIAEMLLQAKAQNNAKIAICMVRFGNVLGSSGSVVPKFKKQLAAGGPLTITHPDISRYFMSISEASQLVLQTASLGSDGEVFVLDMGEPVKILDLAHAMIELSGYRVRDQNNPDGNIKIEITGLRPGEKMFEEMFIGEDAEPTKVRKIFRASESFLEESELDKRLAWLESNLPAMTKEKQKSLLMDLLDDTSFFVKQKDTEASKIKAENAEPLSQETGQTAEPV